MGGSPDCTLRSRAVSSEPASLLVTQSIGPSTPPPPTSLGRLPLGLQWSSCVTCEAYLVGRIVALVVPTLECPTYREKPKESAERFVTLPSVPEGAN